jgi:hypothetical protein
MKKIYVYFIDLCVLLFFALPASAQDTINLPLKIRLGAELTGPAVYFTDKNILNAEGFLSVDLNEARSVSLYGGYTNYAYSNYNYNYFAKGLFFKGGMDFNLLIPEKNQGRYWAGIGLHYGVSRFTSEIPSFTTENYWGSTTSSVGKKASWGHFIEISPGVRAEIFRNVSIGWNVNARLLLYPGNAKDLRPLYFPGFGNGGKRVSTGVSYYISFNIPYKRINVITKPPQPQVSEEPVETNRTGTGGGLTR